VAVCFLVLNCATAWGLDPHKDISHYIIDEWSTDNSNIPQNSVLCMTQTRDGYLWIGTYEGLCRFDGLHFTVFDKSNSPEIQNNGMLVMAKGPDGALWVGTPNGLLCRRNGKFRNYTVADGLSGDFILALAFDSTGSLWVGTTQGLCCFRDGVFVRIKAADKVQLSYVSALCAGPDGMLWIGTSDGLFGYQAGSFISLVLPGGRSNNSVWSLCLARDGTLWIGTAGDQLVTYRNGIFRSYSRQEGLSGNRVRVIYEDRNGTLWVGTDDGGLDRFEGGTFSSIDTTHGLLNDSIRALGEDHEGSLWIGTFGGGLSRLKDDRYIFYTTRDGLPVDMTRSVMQDRAGDIWIGTIGGGLVRFSAGRFQTIDIGKGSGDKRVWSIAQAGDGAIWIGTYGHGLHRLKDGKILIYTTQNGLCNDIVRAVLAARDGSIWAGTNGGGIDVLHPDGRIVNYSRRNGLGDDFIYAISQDGEGTIWVGTYNGDLYRFRDGKLTVYQPRTGTSQNAIWAIRPDPDGALWLGTNSGGLIRFKNNQFRTISSRNGLYSDVAFQILEDDHGFFWMNCNRGVFRVSKQELNDFADGRIPSVHSLSFGVSEGVRGVESTGPAQPAGWKTRDGMLWFPTIKGVAVVDPDYRKRNEHVPLVHIEKMTVEGTAVDLASPLSFGPGRKKLEFTFTALSFLVSGKNRFKTWLQGFDRGWSAETSQRQTSYTNLPPGGYDFRVIACNNDGVWNEQGATLHFVLRPYFFQTYWFLAVVAGLLFGLALMAFRWRFRRMKRRARQLEAQVRERTRELSRVNEELLQANRVQDEMQRIAVHDLKNPLQAIMGAADLIMQQNRGLPGGAMLAEKVSLASRRMLALINEMLEISRFERGDFKLELQTVDLSELLMLVSRGFSEQMQRKRQQLALALETECLVMGDLEWLKEIFDNLLSNAVKFSPFQAEIGISTLCREKTALVIVRDQGPGLTAEDQKKLFGKFQRLSAKPTGGESSTGLGLSIAELLVRKHGGLIWAESVPGQGSRFIVELPRA
jgi:signal transduction histidine kinase/ligand-binding sensor domain-containing protein